MSYVFATRKVKSLFPTVTLNLIGQALGAVAMPKTAGKNDKVGAPATVPGRGPGASSASRASSKVIRVYIDNTGETYVDGQPVKTWAIQGKLRDMSSRCPSYQASRSITGLTGVRL